MSYCQRLEFVKTLVFTAFLLDFQHRRNMVNIKPASLLVVSLDKIPNRTPLLLLSGLTYDSLN